MRCSCRLLLRRRRAPGAPLELDRLPHHLGVVQLEVAYLLGDVLAHGLRLEVGDEVGDEAAVRLRLEVAHLLRLLHGGLQVLVVAHLLACAFYFKYQNDSFLICGKRKCVPGSILQLSGAQIFLGSLVHHVWGLGMSPFSL